jgi:hypothetical protein
MVEGPAPMSRPARAEQAGGKVFSPEGGLRRTAQAPLPAHETGPVSHASAPPTAALHVGAPVHLAIMRSKRECATRTRLDMKLSLPVQLQSATAP